MAAAKYGNRISSRVDLPDNRFDGVFANAALFHIPSQELPRLLLKLRATLKPAGVLLERARP